GPILQTQLCYIWYEALAVWIRAASESLRRHNCAEDIARAVAFCTVTWAIDEIRPAVPCDALGGIWFIHFTIKEQQFPESNTTPDGEREGEVMAADFTFDRRQGFDVSKEIAEIVGCHAPVGSIRERGIVVLSIG